jgi:predicted transcriptional regulator
MKQSASDYGRLVEFQVGSSARHRTEVEADRWKGERPIRVFESDNFAPIGRPSVRKSLRIPQVFIPRAVKRDVSDTPTQTTEETMADSDDKALVSQILSSYLSNNTVSAQDLSSVVESVKRAFGGGAVSAALVVSEAESHKWQPAVSIKKSVSPDELTCLCCGEKFKSLKRHLQTEHQLTPEGYRAAFDLKSDYPVVAPVYSARRSALAIALGLGRKPVAQSPAKKVSPRGRPAKKVAA